MVLGAVWLAGWFDGNRWQVLAIAAPPLRVSMIGACFLVMMAVSLAYTMLVFQLRPDVVRADLATFVPLITSSAWPVYALIIIVGAPLSEELLFRGFLQPALAQSRIGFVGASLVTTTAWTALHMQYSVFGLAEIFVIGLLFCCVLWRTGSLWVPIILHALYNGSQFVAVKFGLLPWT
jgi:uncharacterized protein